MPAFLSLAPEATARFHAPVSGIDTTAQQVGTDERLTGDWAGWIYLDGGGDAPLRIHVRSEHDTVTLDFPHAELYGDTLASFEVAGDSVRFGRSSSEGTRQDWIGTIAGGTIKGTFWSGGERTGVFQLHRSVEPLPIVHPERYADCTGIYRFESGRSVIVTSRFWGELLYLDSESGRFATLFPTSQSTFFAGSAMYVPDTVTARARCLRDSEGAVTGLEWMTGDEAAEIGRAVHLEAEDVRFSSGDVSLAGTLITPPETGPHPAIVMLGGSNWTERGSQRAQADILASAGLAVLIYDKRGFGESTGDATVPFEETAEDALAAVRYLQARADIDRVGLAGRSRGGWFAPLAASRSDDVAFLVLFVGPAVSPAEQETTRRLNALRDMGHSGVDLELARHYLSLLWRYGRTETGWDAYATGRREIEARGWLDVLGGPETPDEGWDWMRMNMHYDPIPALEQVTAPVLAVFGAEDDNVIPEINVPQMRAALERAGNEDVTILLAPNADHSLRRTEQPGTPLHRRTGYPPELWSTVLDWLVERIALGVR